MYRVVKRTRHDDYPGFDCLSRHHELHVERYPAKLEEEADAMLVELEAMMITDSKGHKVINAQIVQNATMIARYVVSIDASA